MADKVTRRWQRQQDRQRRDQAAFAEQIRQQLAAPIALGGRPRRPKACDDDCAAPAPV